MSSAVQVAERSLQQIAEIERQMRSRAESVSQEYARLLSEVASHFAGEALSKEREHDPQAPNGWSPERWRGFLHQQVFLRSGPWGAAGAVHANDKRIATLEAENKRLKAQIEALQRQKAMQSRQSQTPQAIPAAIPLEAAVPLEAEQLPETERPAPLPEPAREQAYGHAEALAILRDWPNLPVPARFARLFEGVEPGRWQRQAQALYLVASWGLCARIEVEQILAQFETPEVKRPTALRQALDHLGKLKLLYSQRLQVRSTLETSLVVLELSENGQKLCRSLGFPERAPEFPRLAAALPDPERQLAALAFAFHARQQGYLALAAPPAVEGVQPDVYVEKGAERYAVFTGGDADELLTRWQQGEKLQTPCAVCTFDEPTRSYLAALCKASGRPGASADLGALLRSQGKAPLWSDTW